MLSSASPPLWARSRLEVRGNRDVSHLAVWRQADSDRVVRCIQHTFCPRTCRQCQVEKLPVWQFNSLHRRSSSGTGGPCVAFSGALPHCQLEKAPPKEGWERAQQKRTAR